MNWKRYADGRTKENEKIMKNEGKPTLLGNEIFISCFSLSSFWQVVRSRMALTQVSLRFDGGIMWSRQLRHLFPCFRNSYVRVKVRRLAIRYVALFYCTIFVLKTNRRKYTNKFYENIPSHWCLRRRRRRCCCCFRFVVGVVVLILWMPYSDVYLPLNAIVIVHFLRSVIFTFKMFVDILLSPRRALFREWEHSAPIQRNGLQCALLSHHYHHHWCSCSDC